MATNMEELEKKMEMKMEGVRAMMVDRFSEVDRKLTAIEELLKKIVETQNQDKRKKVAIKGGDGGPSHESGTERPMRAEVSQDDDDQNTNDQIRGPQGWLHRAGIRNGWVGLYSHQYGKASPQGTDFGRGKGFCGPAWTGQSGFKENGWSSLGKTGQDENFKDSFRESWMGSSGQVADKTDAGGLQDSLKPDDCAKKETGSMESDEGRDWSKITEEKVDSKHGEGSNEKGHEESQKPASCGLNEEGSGSKRKQPDSPVEGRNDSPISTVPLTATRQRLNIFTTDEQEILNEIEPIMQSIRRIMNKDGYKDGDPLSADDQTYILDNVFNHHPSKAKKLGAGVDYIMINKYMNVGGSRCFHIVSTDGRKEDFSYHKCLKNFLRGKYPGKSDKFIHKYFKNSEPRHTRNRDCGSGSHGPWTPRSWSGWDRETRVAGDEARTSSPAWRQMRGGHPRSVGTKQNRTRWQWKAAP